MSSSVPRYSNTTALTTASSATSPAAAANKALKRHNSFTLTSTATNHGQHHHHDYRDQDNDDDDDDNDECNDLIPPRPPDVLQEGMHSNELPKRLTSYELMPPAIKPSSSMPNDLPNTKYLHKTNSSAGAGEHTSDDGGDSQYHGSQSNILMPRPPYRSHSRSTSKSYNVSNSNLTTTTTLASSTLSNLSTNSGIMSRSTGRNMISSGGGGGGGGYGLNSYGSNSNNGGGPLGSRYAHARTQQNIEPRTTPYYYHELMQKSAVFDSDLNLLNEVNQADNANINSANGDEIGSSSPSAGHNVGSQQQPLYHQHHLSSLNGSLDNVLEATRKDLNDLILGNSLLYNQSHSSNDLLNNNTNGNSSSAGTLVDHDHDDDHDDDEQQHHSLGYSINTSTNSHQNPIPAVRNISNSNSSSAYLKRSSQHHSLHASNSNILNRNNNNSNNNHHHHSSSYHHLNHPNEKYVA